MSGTHTVHFANFICRFGDAKVLLDLADEVVLPAFLERRQRKYGASQFFFQETELINFGTDEAPELIVAGRFIHDTLLTRDQVLQEGKLVKDHASMPSAPSALFAMVLDTHKLLYLPETKQAPSLTAFKATSEKFIKTSYHEFLKGRTKHLPRNERVAARADLAKEFPSPTIEVVPLSSGVSLEQFLDQFKVLRQMRIELVAPNDEIDSSSLIKHMRATSQALGASDGALIYRGAGDGLSQKQALIELTPIVDQGNAKVTLSGDDFNGDKLIGNQDKFKMGTPIAEVSQNVRDAARDLYSVFTDKVSVGLVKVQQVGQGVRDKVAKLATKATKGNEPRH